jgi:hypothetical protein
MHREIARALDAALTLASDGQRCFPCFKNKRPVTSHGFNAASDRDEVRELWARYPAPFVGVVTGEISNIDVLDIDAPRDADAATWLAASRERLPVTPEQNLPSRPTKTTDTRSRGFGAISVELHAISPVLLRAIVKEAIEERLRPDQFRVLKAAEANERKLIAGLVGMIEGGMP